MSDAVIAGGQAARFHAHYRQTPRLAENASTAATQHKRRPFRRLRTIGGLGLHGMKIDITPQEISEDLDYGRD